MSLRLLIVVVVVLVALFGAALWLGSSRDDGSLPNPEAPRAALPAWTRSPLERLQRRAPLEPTAVEGSCRAWLEQLGSGELRLVDRLPCRGEVVPAGGPFARAGVRTLTLDLVEGALQASARPPPDADPAVPVDAEVEAGERLELPFTADGGELTLRCTAPPCRLRRID